MHQKRMMATLGYTLIELLITMAMVAILSVLAISNYREYVQRAARMEAKSVLLQAQHWMEQQFTLNNSYLYSGQEPVLPASLSKSPISGVEKYRHSVLPGTTATSYTLQAVPVQTDQCGTFTLDQTGLRGLSGAHTATAESCWAN